MIPTWQDMPKQPYLCPGCGAYVMTEPVHPAAIANARESGEDIPDDLEPVCPRCNECLTPQSEIMGRLAVDV